MPTLSEIRVYPVKSLDPESVESVRLTEDGAPAPDRRYAIFDADGDYVNGKNERQIHRIRSEFDLGANRLRLRTIEQNEWTVFDPDEDRAALESWLGEYFEYDVTVRRNDEQGYPDDTNATGPTLISTGTLQAMASWFDGEGEWPDLGEAELHRRFRPNLVVDAPAFWEDRLYADRESTVSFSVGDVTLDGVIRIVASVYRVDRTLSCGRSQNVLQRSVSIPVSDASSRRATPGLATQIRASVSDSSSVAERHFPNGWLATGTTTSTA